MLALKLFLVPAFLGLVSLAGRRWGPAVAGWLAGLPLVGGPILAFLAVERGAAFAAQAATASLAAVAAWSVIALVLAQLPFTVWGACATALCALLLALPAFPRLAMAGPAKPLPQRELFVRMAAGAALTLAVTGAAGALGATWSGLFTVFPLLGSVLAVFSHAGHGAAYAVTLLRAMASGLFGFAAFCLCVALALPAHGIAMAFAAGVVVSLLVQWCVLMTPNQVRVQAAAK